MSIHSNLTPEIRGLMPHDVNVFGSLLTVHYRTPRGIDLDPFRIAHYANALGLQGFTITKMVTNTRPVKVITCIEFICEKRL